MSKSCTRNWNVVRLVANKDISDYDVFLSPLEDFKAEVEKAGLQEKTVYLDRGDEFRFEVRQP